ncbi:NADP-binding Rossmann-like domain containing protein [Nitzschia inconspicua]|uniref:NADP-binding Rossmann-like domain containing protein n=1 Tax=Nitzschia inconspicua TaxID=303405 RepID=A0A9K3KXK3_9STRA|nr:NADP-binding Rossmann-like domain containing protein [Nitzschia inconspicua]
MSAVSALSAASAGGADSSQNVLSAPRRIAIIGGGITGSVAANHLSKHLSNCEVHVFDQGRRGPGGRASHRSVSKRNQTVLPDDDENNDDNSCIGEETTFEFDHGCQFFRADSTDMQTELLQSWLEKGWAAPWKAKFGCLPTTTSTSNPSQTSKDFFGIPTIQHRDVYIGVGGMHRLPRKILQDSAAIVHSRTRVARVERNDNEAGRWDIHIVTGNAAYHDTKEKEATGVSAVRFDKDFDAVIFTDVSSASDIWHRASAGIPDEFRHQLPPKVRIPLFSCMVALEGSSIGDQIPFDAFTTASSSDVLWFAAKSKSKPGFPSDDNHECWTLISTPSYAVQQVKETTMRDPVTGEFQPQESDYLNSIPGPALVEAFFDVVRAQIATTHSDNKFEPPNIVYLQAQRWGSGLPAPETITTDVQDICGTRYAATLTSSLVYQPPPSAAVVGGDSSLVQDFVMDDTLGLYYAGDFCSHRNPGFEAAALSGLNVAKYILTKSALPTLL